MSEPVNTRKLTRNDLNRIFNGDQRIVRAFESALQDITESLPTNTSTAQSTADEAVNSIGAIPAQLAAIQEEIARIKESIPVDVSTLVYSMIGTNTSGGSVPTVQRGRCDISGGSQLATATLSIPLTDLSKVQVTFLGSNGGSASFQDALARFQSITNTTITFTRSGTVGVCEIAYQVAEWT